MQAVRSLAGTVSAQASSNSSQVAWLARQDNIVGEHAYNVHLPHVEPAKVAEDAEVAPAAGHGPHHRPGCHHLLDLQGPHELVWGRAEQRQHKDQLGGDGARGNHLPGLLSSA